MEDGLAIDEGESSAKPIEPKKSRDQKRFLKLGLEIQLNARYIILTRN